MTPAPLEEKPLPNVSQVMHRETIIFKTEEGEAVITARKGKNLKLSHSKKGGKPRIPGRIVGSLDTADAELREYLSRPN